MKSVAVLLLIALVTLGLVGGAVAQTSASPAAPSAQAPASPSGPSSVSGSVSTPSGDLKGQMTIDRKNESRSSDDGSALPRTVTSERTTIFGLSPTAAVVIAAALLVVVILAIVAMTRSNDTYISTNRRV